VILLLGQTAAIFDYGFAVRIGLQEPEELITPFGVEVNRAMGAGDTVVYFPLIVLSLIGLWRRRPWALPVTAAVMGISAYWSTGCAFLLAFLPGLPGYKLSLRPDLVVTLAAYIIYGTWGLLYLALRGERLLSGGGGA